MSAKDMDGNHLPDSLLILCEQTKQHGYRIGRAFHNEGSTVFNKDTTACQKHGNDRLPLLSVIQEAQHVSPATL